VTRAAPIFGGIGKGADFLSKERTEGSAHIGNSSAMTRCLALAAVLLAGCVRIQAHQRGYLAQPTMNPQAAPLEQKLDTHVQEYREGSIGGTGVGGGGCGCN
jgi:uncharacterized protein DUF4266